MLRLATHTNYVPVFSSPAFSTPAIWSLVFQSRVFSRPIVATFTHVRIYLLTYVIWGAWPLIIWEAITAKRNLSEITVEPINSTSSRTTVSNLGGGGLGKIWGACAPLAPT